MTTEQVVETCRKSPVALNEIATVVILLLRLFLLIVYMLVAAN